MRADLIEREHTSTAAAAAAAEAAAMAVTATVLLDKDVSIVKLFFLGRQSRTKTKADFLCESVFMAALCNRAGHYIFALWFLLSMFLFGSRPSDHYFRSVCLPVCLFVCAEFFSAVFDPISIKLRHMLCVWV